MKIKKKILSMLIGIGVVLSLTACGAGEKSKETTGTKDSISVESTSEIENETSSIDLETTSIDLETTSQEVTTQESTTQEPTTQESTTQEPTTQEPTAQEPTTQEPTTQEPTTQEPTTQKPTTQKPTQEPTTPAVVVDENRDKYVAAKKVTDMYSGQAAAIEKAYDNYSKTK